MRQTGMADISVYFSHSLKSVTVKRLEHDLKLARVIIQIH